MINHSTNQIRGGKRVEKQVNLTYFFISSIIEERMLRFACSSNIWGKQNSQQNANLSMVIKGYGNIMNLMICQQLLTA